MMCSWSSWSFICDGHFEIVLAILLGIAGALALALALTLYRHKQHRLTPEDRRILHLMRAYQQGDLDTDQMLAQLHRKN